MRIPFLKARKRTPTLYQHGIQSGVELNQRAQVAVTRLFVAEKAIHDDLKFIIEQVYIVYALSSFAGSHIVNDLARKALCNLRQEHQDSYNEIPYTFNALTALSCSMALKEGVAVLKELPRSEFKIAYVQAKKITESRQSITNYLRLFQ